MSDNELIEMMAIENDCWDEDELASLLWDDDDLSYMFGDSNNVMDLAEVVR